MAILVWLTMIPSSEPFMPHGAPASTSMVALMVSVHPPLGRAFHAHVATCSKPEEEPAGEAKKRRLYPDTPKH